MPGFAVLLPVSALVCAAAQPGTPPPLPILWLFLALLYLDQVTLSRRPPLGGVQGSTALIIVIVRLPLLASQLFEDRGSLCLYKCLAPSKRSWDKWLVIHL